MKRKDDSVYIDHMIDSIDSIYKFIENMTYDEFYNDDLVSSAVVRKLEILGEASGKVSDELKQIFPNVEWRILKDFRNYLIHQYFGVDIVTVWEAINQDMPILKEKLETIKIYLLNKLN